MRKTSYLFGQPTPSQMLAERIIEDGAPVRIANSVCILLVLFGAGYCFYQFLAGETGPTSWQVVGQWILARLTN